MYFLFFIITLIIDIGCQPFTPRIDDYDGYGLKITGNKMMMIEVLGDSRTFLIQQAPYNSTSQLLQCAIMYNHSNEYVYSVGIGKRQNSSQLYFFYAGELVLNNSSNTNSLDHRNIFIGILINKDPHKAQIYEDTDILFNCNYFQYESLQFISSYRHQEFFVVGVEPYGQYAVGISQDFAFIYRPFSDNMIEIKNSSLIWPANTLFIPLAVDTAISFTIVAGFVLNGPLYRVRATPTVYVISNSNLTILSTWSYSAVFNSWQSYLTYSNLNMWSNNYVMSVSINGDDCSRVLIGMPFLNTVFLLIVSLNGSNITLDSFVDEGKSIGFGKSVAWLSNYQAVILSSKSPRNDSSKIYLYKTLNNKTFPSSPAFVFPNIQQNLPLTINARFIRMISIGNSLAILGIDGEILLILHAPAGYFASTTFCTSESKFVVSESVMCISGTYKSDDSIFPCSLCPSGTRNPGNLSAISCMSCSSDKFCPMGAISEIDRDYLVPRKQAYAHPRSPEVTIFDEILLQNMFSIGLSNRCLFYSPMFWVLSVAAFVLIIVFSMVIIKQCIQHPIGHRVRFHVKRIFRQTDIIHEGKLWVGGLFSFTVVVLLIFAYTFSAAFYKEYPSENTASLKFACAETISNVKYESGLQSLSIPASHKEQPIFNLLNTQHFTLRLDLLNTIVTCQNLFVQQIRGLSTGELISNCTNSFGILSTTVELPYQTLTIKWTINNIAPIGAVRISLLGDENKNELYYLKQLDFSGTFYDKNNRTLAQTININADLTKAINETEPLIGHQSQFSGIWYPTFIFDENDMFISSEDYVIATNLTYTTLTVSISETSYYIKNRQMPIAKLHEIIFHNLLFTIVCIEIFRLINLLYILMVDPLLRFLVQHYRKQRNILPLRMENINHDVITDDSYTITDDCPPTADDHDTIIDNDSTTTNDHNVV